MGNFFPRWTNWVPLKLAVAVFFIIVGTSIAVPYYFTPKYTRVGYMPTQPVPFSHKVHVGQNGMDCRYCHSFGERSSHANVPANQICFNCHGNGKGGIKLNSPKLEPVRKAMETGEPIKWVKIHKAPDYVYFNHSAHLNRGVSCVSCHGKINEMDVVYHDQPQSMGWCLDCHRNPENNLRPLTEITNLDWKPESLDREAFYAGLIKKGASAAEIAAEIPDGKDKPAADAKALAELASKVYGDKVTQREVGLQLKKHWAVSPSQDCTTCHR
jgi:cytochrome c553